MSEIHIKDIANGPTSWLEVLALPTTGPTNATYIHRVAFAVRPPLLDGRKIWVPELADRLMNLESEPLLLAVEVWVLLTDADVAMRSWFAAEQDLDLLRATSAHREVMTWYFDHFDDRLRRTADAEVIAMRESEPDNFDT